MDLNITIEVFLSLTSVLLTLFASILLIYQNYKNPDRALVAMSFSYFGLSMYLLFSGLGYLLLSPEISMIKNVFLILIALGITMTTNQMVKGKMIDPLVVFISFVSAFGIFPYFSSVDQSISLMTFGNGTQSLQNIGFNRTIISVLFIYIILIILYFSIKIFISTPKPLRKEAFLYFLGNIFLIFATISFVSGFSVMVPGIVELLISVGILISSYGLIRAPQILYLLPFNAIKLSIIKSDSGISFYNYYWQGNLNTAADQLFGAAFLAITNFMAESVGEGVIQEIKLEGATLTISKPGNYDFYYVVIATKPSYVLQKGLQAFSRAFERTYGDILMKNSHEVQQFDEVDDLIPVCFPYIPAKIS